MNGGNNMRKKTTMLGLLATLMLVIVSLGVSAACGVTQVIELANATFPNSTNIDPAILTSSYTTGFAVNVSDIQTAANLTLGGNTYNLTDSAGHRVWSTNFSSTAPSGDGSVTATVQMQNSTGCKENQTFTYFFRSTAAQFTHPASNNEIIEAENLTIQVNFSHNRSTVLLNFGNSWYTMDSVNNTNWVYRLNNTPSGSYDFYVTSINSTNLSAPTHTSQKWSVNIRGDTGGSSANINQMKFQQAMSTQEAELMSIGGGQGIGNLSQQQIVQMLVITAAGFGIYSFMGKKK
jgi:hypothetical protein